MGKATLYPDLQNLFTEIRTGRPLSYTPLEIAQKFEEYIQDLADNPICVETEYTRTGTGNEDPIGQTRIERHPASPTISDFVARWLGKSNRWWSELDKVQNPKRRELYIAVKNRISVYCRKVKLNGAEVGIYNYNIVARELGLVDKQSVENTGKTIQYVVSSQDDADELKKASSGVGLVE